VKQPSLVQGLLSSQLKGAPGWQAPATQVSFAVQGLPSLHDPLTGVCTQAPVAGSQLSAVQTLLSLQLSGSPGWHEPFSQRSKYVQGLSSALQGRALLGCTHAPVLGSQ